MSSPKRLLWIASPPVAEDNSWLPDILIGCPYDLVPGPLEALEHVRQSGADVTSSGFAGRAPAPVRLEAFASGSEEADWVAAEIGRRFGDRDLSSLACSGRARALIRLGNLAQGVALLDEAMAAVVAGDVTPILAGDIYCIVCDSDIARAWAPIPLAICTQPNTSAASRPCSSSRRQRAGPSRDRPADRLRRGRDRGSASCRHTPGQSADHGRKPDLSRPAAGYSEYFRRPGAAGLRRGIAGGHRMALGRPRRRRP